MLPIWFKASYLAFILCFGIGQYQSIRDFGNMTKVETFQLKAKGFDVQL
jgi:hypothetical protein